MTYRDEIRPWAIFRCGDKNICVARFRTRSDADSYMSILRRMTSGKFVVAFDQQEEVSA
ncbi:hypothetical protein NOS3756_53960 [Nostoc sp. NIES-3756]|uniref:hypothetical protein n=1 Tax=Nostoc sp. NIES-3756 TaxID=1751286 RepID=UPI00072300C3|nr:hypothetical protein [Nostoc sp. NIES-3756]BAT56391.1 hypothetical protein NOS3756_53960 [Nostoc sp. NIES-3756]